MSFIGCATALPMGVAPESLGNRWRLGEDLNICLHPALRPSEYRVFHLVVSFLLIPGRFQRVAVVDGFLLGPL